MGVYSKENITQPCPDFITNRYELALYGERVLLNFEIEQLAPREGVFLLLKDHSIVWSREILKLHELRRLSESSLLRKRGAEEREDENPYLPPAFLAGPQNKVDLSGTEVGCLLLKLLNKPRKEKIRVEAKKGVGEASKAPVSNWFLNNNKHTLTASKNKLGECRDSSAEDSKP